MWCMAGDVGGIWGWLGSCYGPNALFKLTLHICVGAMLALGVFFLWPGDTVLVGSKCTV